MRLSWVDAIKSSIVLADLLFNELDSGGAFPVLQEVKHAVLVLHEPDNFSHADDGALITHESAQ